MKKITLSFIIMRVFTKLGLSLLAVMISASVVWAQSSVENGPKKPHSAIVSDAQFDLQFEWPVGVGGGEAGIETDGSYIYTTKWNGADFYKYEMDGTYLESFTCGTASNVRDLAYDGTYFYGAAASTSLFQMDFNSQTTVSTITAPTDCRALAYNEDDGYFYGNNWGSDITVFDMTGSLVNSFPVGPVGDSYYGFAYDNYSGGTYLWGYAQVGATLNELVQIDLPAGTETGTYFDVGSVLAATSASAGGLCIDSNLVTGYWTIMGTSQNINIWGVELISIQSADVGIQSIVAPESGVNLGSAEAVTVTVKNYGTDAQSNFNVGFSLDGGTYVFEAITTTINSGNSIEYTFVVTVDLSAYGTYEFEACTFLAGDEVTDNDCKTKTVENFAPSLCLDGLYTNGCSYGDGITYWDFAGINVPVIECGNGDPYDWYHDYTDMIHSFNPGMNYTLTVQVGYVNTFIDVWIDYNDDLFFDEDEHIVNDFECAEVDVNYEIAVTIPADTSGTHIMRYRTNWQSSVGGSCDTYVHGNMCDFTGNISNLFVPLYLTGDICYNNVTLAWTALYGDPIGFNIYRDGSVIGNTTDTIYSDMGLTSGTYAYNITAVYDEGESLPSSTYSVFISYINSLPDIQSFETSLGDWIQSSDDDFDWTNWQGQTESSDTGPDTAYEGNYYMYTEASFPNSPFKSGGLHALFDFSEYSEPKFSYWYHMYGINTGELRLQVSIDNGASWTDKWNLTGDQGNQWFNNVVDLSSYGSMNGVIIRFWATTGNGYRSDMAIDFIEVYEEVPPECANLISPPDGEVNVSVNPSLNWESVLMTDGYLIYIGTDNPPTNIQNGLDIGNITNFPPFTLDYGVSYYWQIVPYNQYGTATGCPVWQFSTPVWSLDLKLYLEGPYFSSYMTTLLNLLEYVPLTQPYNTEPWNYTGSESVTEIPLESVVDWILIELHDAENPYELAESTLFAERAAFLLDNGDIVDLDGTSLPEFSGLIENNLYVVIWHRNHIGIISSSVLWKNSDVYAYDFSNGEYKVLGGKNGHKELDENIWGMIACDANSDGQINNEDKNDIWFLQNGLSGYLDGDFNMDGQVNTADKDEYWTNNGGYGMQNTGEIPDFICGYQLIDGRDGQSYSTVQIGEQCWMAENLKATIYQNGTPIPNVTNDISWISLTTGAHVWYENDSYWKEPYGALYNWYAVDDTNGLCPIGWHVPTNDEWTALTDLIGGTGSPHGNELKSCRQVNSPQGGDCDTTEHPRWGESNYNWGTDDYGFSGLPGGSRSSYGAFYFVGFTGIWWSSAQTSSTNAWTRSLYYGSGYVSVGDSSKQGGFSVRCLRDF